MHDFHVHSNYSDGSFLRSMVRAGEEAGLDGIGFADHCAVSARERPKDARAVLGFNLDRTYERRRRGIEHVRGNTSLEIHDAVEMDYDPRDEAEIGDFLDEAEFDYAIGSVHELAESNVQDNSNFAGKSAAELDDLVDRYFETLVALVESELFDIAAHIDVVERTPALRGRATEAQYRRVAEAFADSRTVPEINAGRALTDANIVHPAPAFLDLLRERDVPVTVGSDAHRPDEVGGRVEFLTDFLEERGLEPFGSADVVGR